MNKDVAANIIINALRNRIAEKSYSKMIFGNLHNNLNPQKNKANHKFKDISQTNLLKLASLLFENGGPLKEREFSFLNTFINMDFYIIHFSPIKIGQNKNGNISLFSRDKLLKLGIKFNKSNTSLDDIEQLSDTDFVFFSLTTNENKKNKSRFGEIKYQKKVSNDFFQAYSVCMTLDDAATSNFDSLCLNGAGTPFFINSFFSHLNQPGKENAFEKFREIIFSDLFQEKVMNQLNKNIRFHLFFGNDILSGLGLCIIYFNRMLSKAVHSGELNLKISDIWLWNHVILDGLRCDEESLNRLNALINGWIRPIIKIPNFVFI